MLRRAISGQGRHATKAFTGGLPGVKGAFFLSMCDIAVATSRAISMRCRSGARRPRGVRSNTCRDRTSPRPSTRSDGAASRPRWPPRISTSSWRSRRPGLVRSSARSLAGGLPAHFEPACILMPRQGEPVVLAEGVTFSSTSSPQDRHSRRHRAQPAGTEMGRSSLRGHERVDPPEPDRGVVADRALRTDRAGATP